MKRSEIREAVFFLVFESMFSSDSPDMIINTAYEVDNFEMVEDAEILFKKIHQKADELDEIIAQYSEKRQVGRIPKVSLAILRIALYEFIYDDKVPGNVAISEAVILTKKFAHEPDVQFVNGVLGEFSRKKESENK